ncbi:MAG: bifunctional adenosylcobinamide hydrolase/alpha-ribazole phosphatase CbiS [Methanomethylophilus sp.]
MKYVKATEVHEEDRHEATAVIRLTERMEVLSSAPLHGGNAVTDTLFIMQVPHDFHDPDYLGLLKAKSRQYGLPEDAVGFMTAAEVKYVFSTAEPEVAGCKVFVAATAGVTNCVEAGQELKDWDRKEARSQEIYRKLVAGTINIIAVSPVPLADSAKVNLFIPLVEAKTLGMRDIGYHETGTTSDAMAVVSPRGELGEPFAGTGVPLGLAVARGVRQAVAECLRKRGERPKPQDALVMLAAAGVPASDMWDCASVLGLGDQQQADFLEKLAVMAVDPDVCALIIGALAAGQASHKQLLCNQDGDPDSLTDGTLSCLLAGRISEQRGEDAAMDLENMRPLKGRKISRAVEAAAYGLAAGVTAIITGENEE